MVELNVRSDISVKVLLGLEVVECEVRYSATHACDTELNHCPQLRRDALSSLKTHLHRAAVGCEPISGKLC